MRRGILSGVLAAASAFAQTADVKEHEEVRWVLAHDLERYDFAEPHRHVALLLMGKRGKGPHE